MRVNVSVRFHAKETECTSNMRPYPDFFILPLHRLLQVRYFSNKTFLFQTQLTDVLNSRKSVRCRERNKKREVHAV